MAWIVFPTGTCFSDDIEEANELLDGDGACMLRPITVPSRTFIAANSFVVRVALIVVRHGFGAALLQRQSGLCAVKRLNLALFVDRQDDGVCGRIDIEPDDVAQFVDEARIVGQLELAHPVRLQTMGAPDALDRTHAELQPPSPSRLRSSGSSHHRGGSPSQVKATTRLRRLRRSAA